MVLINKISTKIFLPYFRVKVCLHAYQILLTGKVYYLILFSSKLQVIRKYRKLKEHLDHDLWGLTLDVGHVFLTEATGPGECIRRFKNDIKNIHIEDMKKGRHAHLQFGDGEMNFSDIFKARDDINYTGPINVELSRHSTDAVNAAQFAYNYLSAYV